MDFSVDADGNQLGIYHLRLGAALDERMVNSLEHRRRPAPALTCRACGRESVRDPENPAISNFEHRDDCRLLLRFRKAYVAWLN